MRAGEKKGIFRPERERDRALTLFGLPEGGLTPGRSLGREPFQIYLIMGQVAHGFPWTLPDYPLSIFHMLPGGPFSDTPITCAMLW